MHLAYHKKGFTLVEMVISAAIFLVIALGLYEAYTSGLQATKLARFRVAATALANEQYEIARNLSYDDVGIADGYPAGSIPRTKTITRSNMSFLVNTTVRSIDDPFDGQIGSTTATDLSPADYKLVELEIGCINCEKTSTTTFTAFIGPRALETATPNGALFVRAIDASGNPIADADVTIRNIATSTPLVINDSTNLKGELQIVDAPPGAGAYRITVSKAGYSTERTYPIGSSTNPNPVKPDATVSVQLLTLASFTIDRTATLNAQTVFSNCQAVPHGDFRMMGAKLIGTSPDIRKYDEYHDTTDTGTKVISNLEWDTYDIEFDDENYYLSGSIPLFPLSVNPGSTQDIKLVVMPKDPRTFMVTVRDEATQLPLSGVSVRLIGPDEFDETLITGRGFLTQTDWAEGPDQVTFSNNSKRFFASENIEYDAPEGELRLLATSTEYMPSGYLTSSTFDTGSVSNFHQILWEPVGQVAETGSTSVRFQIATNNDRETWNFIGPDGTNESYYTIGNQDMYSGHDSDRYLRYRVFLSTEDVTQTPSVSDISFTFTSTCVPPGQVFFSGLSSGDYSVTLTRPGYEEMAGSINIGSNWQQREFIMSPQ